MAVYFVSDPANNRVKIGFTYSRNPAERAKQIASQNKIKNAKVLGFISGNSVVEREAHKRFAHLRIEGEWFKSDPELLDWITDNTRKPDDVFKSKEKPEPLLNPLAGLMSGFADMALHVPDGDTIEKINAIAKARNVFYKEALADLVDEAYERIVLNRQ